MILVETYLYHYILEAQGTFGGILLSWVQPCGASHVCLVPRHLTLRHPSYSSSIELVLTEMQAAADPLGTYTCSLTCWASMQSCRLQDSKWGVPLASVHWLAYPTCYVQCQRCATMTLGFISFGACWSLGRGAGTTHKSKVERPLVRQPSKHSNGEMGVGRSILSSSKADFLVSWCFIWPLWRCLLHSRAITVLITALWPAQSRPLCTSLPLCLSHFCFSGTHSPQKC